MSAVALVVGGSGKRRAFGPFATETAAWDWADAKYPDHRVQVLTMVPAEVAERLGLAPGETLGEWMDRVTGEPGPEHVPDMPADPEPPLYDWFGRELPSGE